MPDHARQAALFHEWVTTCCGYETLHVAEVGVFMPRTCRTSLFITGGHQVTLVEPLPGAAAALRNKWGGLVAVTIHEMAIAREEGLVNLRRLQGQSYVMGVESPFVAGAFRRKGAGKVLVKGGPFSLVDDGTIQAMNLDVEGSEWVVLDTMVSRPKAIEMEWWGPGGYEVPDAPSILDWMKREGYEQVEGGGERINRRWVRVG